MSANPINLPMRLASRLPTLSPRDRRALRLGALALAPILAWALAVAPYRRAVDDAAGRLDAERRLLAGELRLVALAPHYPAAALEGRERLGAASFRLFAGDGGAAGAALAGYVQAAAEEQGVLVTQLDPLPGRAGDAADGAAAGLAALAVEVRGRGDLAGVLMLLRELEEGPRLLRVDGVELTARQAGDAEPEPLAFRFTVAGLAVADSLDDALRTGPAAGSQH